MRMDRPSNRGVAATAHGWSHKALFVCTVILAHCCCGCLGERVSPCGGIHAIGFTARDELNRMNEGEWELNLNQTLWRNRRFGTFLFQTTDGYWYISTEQTLPLSDTAVLAMSSVEADGPRLPSAEIGRQKARMPPNSGWIGFYAGSEVPQNAVEWECTCAELSADACRIAVVVVLGAAVATGVMAFVCVVILSVMMWIRVRRNKNVQGDTSQNQAASNVPELPLREVTLSEQPPEIPQQGPVTPRSRALQALDVINQSVDGLLWVGYKKPSYGNVPGEERFAAIRWIKDEAMDAVANCSHGEDRFCCVCLDRVACCKLLPCEHASFCTYCIIENACRWAARDSPECPVCRGPYHSIVLPVNAVDGGKDSSKHSTSRLRTLNSRTSQESKLDNDALSVHSFGGAPEDGRDGNEPVPMSNTFYLVPNASSNGPPANGPPSNFGDSSVHSGGIARPEVLSHPTASATGEIVILNQSEQAAQQSGRAESSLNSHEGPMAPDATPRVGMSEPFLPEIAGSASLATLPRIAINSGNVF